MIYYGLRYYHAVLGRFINRDPIEERGGLNLYGFCGNDGVNRWDYLGMEDDDEVVKLPPFEVTGGSEEERRDYEAMRANQQAIDSYMMDRAIRDASDPNQTATTTPLGRIDVVETINPETRVHHVSYVGTYSDGRQFAIGFYPRGIKDDRARVNDPRFAPKIIPGGISNATHAQIRAGAVAMWVFASDQGYEAWNDNCGAAVSAGLQAAGNAKPPDYENDMILNTVTDPVIQGVLQTLIPF